MGIGDLDSNLAGQRKFAVDRTVKRVLDYAYQIAGTESNPDAVFKKVEEFSRNSS